VREGEQAGLGLSMSINPPLNTHNEASIALFLLPQAYPTLLPEESLEKKSYSEVLEVRVGRLLVGGLG